MPPYRRGPELLSLDTETTGLDFHHGARPYLVTTCDEAGQQRYWQDGWEPDPASRQVAPPPEDLGEILRLVRGAGRLILQNAKFDVAALNSLDPRFGEQWPWEQTEDTLLASHLLASNQPHDLTSLTFQYLGQNIEDYERRLKTACQAARRLVQQARLRRKRERAKALAAPAEPRREIHFTAEGGFCEQDLFGDWTPEEEGGGLLGKTLPPADWAIAEAGRPDMPSAKGECWKYDGWLPRALVRAGYAPNQAGWWATVLEEYANADSAVTLALWLVMERELDRRGLVKIYRERLKLLPAIFGMEQRGVTLSGERVAKLEREYLTRSEEAGRSCVLLAERRGYELSMPRGGNNHSLRGFCFTPSSQGGLGLPALARSDKTGEPSLDKNVLEAYEATLAEGDALTFVRQLRAKRKCDTGLSYLAGYRRFMLPEGGGRVHRLYPSLNPTGTDTLRCSSSNPNAQNIEKQEVEGKSLRYAFGPAPGREWWSLDAQNIELRIPAYESGERELIELFERPDEPPYYGSVHLLNFHTVYPDLWEKERREVGEEKVGPHCKARYKATWYQWCKNGGFAVQYGAVDREGGTADRAFHRPGAHTLLKRRFGKLEALNQKWLRFAQKNGYVETLPDRSVDPARGYPLLVTRTAEGRVLPTVPLNYHVQGTAMWWTLRAMVRCEARLAAWRAKGFDGWLILQVHDELVFDFPRRGDPVADSSSDLERTCASNLWRARALQNLMARGGEDLGVPTPTGCEYHAQNWGEGVS